MLPWINENAGIVHVQRRSGGSRSVMLRHTQCIIISPFISRELVLYTKHTHVMLTQYRGGEVEHSHQHIFILKSIISHVGIYM